MRRVRVVREVRKSFGNKRIWLTEYGYQTNPPDRYLGVSKAKQARYHAEASLRAYNAPFVDMLIHFLYRDEPLLGRWQSGLQDIRARNKPAHAAFKVPLAQRSRSGMRTVLWGQVRPRVGAQRYRVQRLHRGRWAAVGSTRRTGTRGFFQVVVRAGRGDRFRVVSPRDGVASPPVVVR